jgi:hypothetical protein
MRQQGYQSLQMNESSLSNPDLHEETLFFTVLDNNSDTLCSGLMKNIISQISYALAQQPPLGTTHIHPTH